MIKRRLVYYALALAMPVIFSLAPDLCAEATTFEMSSRYSPAQNTRAIPGEVALNEAEAAVVFEDKLFDRLPVKISLRNQYVGIDSSAALWLPAHLVKLANDLEVTAPFFTMENMFLRIGVTPSFYGDDWNFALSEFRVPLRLVAIYRPSEVWVFVAGAAVFPEFRKLVVPVLGFIYTPNERLSINLVSLRPNISYSLNKKATVFGEWGFSYGEYEVQKDSLQSAVLAYREARVGAGIRYRINRHLESILSAGGALNRTFQYRDSLGKATIDNGVYMEARFEAHI